MTHKFWSFVPDDGFETHATARAARARAERGIDSFRDDAQEGWSEGVGNVCWGTIAQRAVVVASVPRCSVATCEWRNCAPGVPVAPCDGHHRQEFDEVIDYGLVDVDAVDDEAPGGER